MCLLDEIRQKIRNLKEPLRNRNVIWDNKQLLCQYRLSSERRIHHQCPMAIGAKTCSRSPLVGNVLIHFCDVNCASEKSTRELIDRAQREKIRVWHMVCAAVLKGMADDQLIAEWQEIQREIASKVVERHNSDSSSHRKEHSACTEILPIPFGAKHGDDDGHTTSRFEYLPLNRNSHGDEEGRANDDSLYGGVDVSFGPPTTDDANQTHSQLTAVAVYVVLRRRLHVRKSSEVESRQQKQKNKQRRQQHSEILSDDYELVYFDSISYTPNVPYISGYLAFREIEPLQTLVQRQLEQKPECTPRVILVDGNGILHPRRAGIACFLGVRTGIPTIGIGKKLCCVEDCWTIDEAESAIALGLRDAVLATPESMVETDYTIADTRDVSFGKARSCHDDCQSIISSVKESMEMLGPTCRGYAVNLRASNGKILGAALVGHGGRANGKYGKQTSNPIYVSVGHKTSLEGAIVLCTELSYSRIPEPVRFADLLGRKLMRENHAIVESSKSTYR